ncbi:uncharacterized protein N7446_010198 [Penicillium canescens]|uniref:uncharacterized protein n=1 Tax=Penicillium canescens TaxID=5083 RepID=UPI0026E04F07|nr:uncharacterized protein N7446_010198 [Penicillium canescens]KAJ6054186.1 hypothetical protein N7446_010198 [Penicillium canescens]
MNFEKLNIDDSRGIGGSRFFIFRVGPTRAPFYVFRRTNAYSTQGFKNLSKYENRISKLKHDAQNGEQLWQGIAIKETENSINSPQI